MKFNLNLITIGLLAASASVNAADFSVKQANTSKVNTNAYQCKSCTVKQGYQGKVNANVGWASSDDIHSGNNFGDSDAGWRGSVGGDVSYRQGEYHAAMQADELGLDNGYLHLEAGKNNLGGVQLDYSLLTRYDATAQTQLWHNNGLLLPDSHTRSLDLELQREKIGIGLEGELDALLNGLKGYINYDHEDKTGNRRSSLLANSGPINFALPVDATTQNINAGISIDQHQWQSELAYNGSYYRNHINHLSLPYADNVYAATPDNDAHQVSLTGQYLLGSSVINGRLATGRMIQDDNLIQVSGNPLQSWDGEVETLDARIGFSSMLSPRWRLNGQLDYSDRDNKSSTWDFAQFEVDNVSGAFKQNVAMDIQRTNFKLQSSYRFNSDYRLLGGFDYKAVERNYTEREETEDSALWAKLNIRAIPKTVVDLKASYETRDGSTYDSLEATSIEENPLLRKFYLADRNRNGLELRVNHTPLQWLTVDFDAHYNNDDYDSTLIGLTGVKDYGYNVQLSAQLSNRLNVFASAGQQWIESDMAGSQAYSSPDWYTNVDDEFIDLNIGFTYDGLMDDRLSIGGNYQFANSASDTLITTTTDQPYGDYYSYSHNLELYGRYALNERMGLKLSYQYERYYDTDYTEVSPYAVPGLVTLGGLNHNYNAHLLMLTFSYMLP
ncbi:MtrB/PioB family decaheme-associated outer membrane protein [Shewanella mangrovisoli]|uniref:MtrB/PioB family decaheme-associated outer membrane protein n=1 Tax=Shewanella mangrovisoli TaxID=2864211 RepID=UPI0035BB406E